MHCPYCRSINEKENPRCARCGRRLTRTPARPAPDGYVDSYQAHGSAAPVLEFEAREHHFHAEAAMAAAAGAESRNNGEAGPGYEQQALFRDPINHAGLRVVPIPTLTPHRPNSTASKRARAKRRTIARPPRRLPDPQQDLQFTATSSELHQRPEERIECDAPVAVPEQRLLAAAVDGSFILFAVCLFGCVFYLLGGETLPLRTAMFTLLGVWTTVTLFYKALWSIADADTPGLRMAGLRIVDFDGRPPVRKVRIIRSLTGMLSVASAGVGVLWVLVDEERLAWHDHISKTFPTSAVL